MIYGQAFHGVMLHTSFTMVLTFAAVIGLGVDSPAGFPLGGRRRFGRPERGLTFP